MVRRLARPERSAAPQSLQIEGQRDPLPILAAEGRVHKKTPRFGTVGQLAEAWAKGRNPRQAKLARLINPIADLSPHQLTTPSLAALLTTWKANHTAGTARTYRQALHQIISFIDSVAGTRLDKGIPRAPVPQPRRTTITDADFGKLIAAAKPHFRAFLLICRTLGLRANEAVLLTPHNYNPDTNTLTFRRKDEGSSGLPLTPELAALIRFAAEKDAHAPIIATLRGGPQSYHALRYQFSNLCRKCGVTASLTLHDLRRTVATVVYNNTHDLRIVQHILGHRNLNSTLHYIGPLCTRDAVEAAITAALPQQSLEAMRPATEKTQ